MAYTTLEELKSKLASPNPKSDFDDIAVSLMRNFNIETGKEGVHYEILEMEFYLYQKDEHDDDSVFGRNCHAGQWFIHGSGVDLTFETKTVTRLFENHEECLLIQYGGILIRGMRKVVNGTNTEIFGGPQRCMFELFNKATQIPVLVPCDKREGFDIYKGTRVLKSYSNLKNAKYRYFVNGITWNNKKDRIIARKRLAGRFVVKDETVQIYDNAPYIQLHSEQVK